MNEQQVVRLLQAHGLAVRERSEIPNGTGIALHLTSGQLVNIFETGTVQVQGKNPSVIETVLAGASETAVAVAPPISDEPGAFAMYKPELDGKHVLVVTVDEIRKIEALFKGFAQLPLTCAVFLVDGYMRTLSVDQLCAHENAPRQPIRSITIHTESDRNDPKAEVMISDVGSDNLTVEIYGEPSKVETLRNALEDRFAAMTPGYAWIARREMAPFAMIAFVGILMTMAASAWGPAIAMLIFGLLLTQKNRYFPRTAFRIGQGEKRYEFASTMRIAVLLSAVVSLATSMLLFLFGL